METALIVVGVSIMWLGWLVFGYSSFSSISHSRYRTISISGVGAIVVGTSVMGAGLLLIPF